MLSDTNGYQLPSWASGSAVLEQAGRSHGLLHDWVEHVRGRRLDGLLAASPDHVFLLDLAGHYVYVNPAAAAAIAARGGAPDEIVGHTARQLGLPPAFVAQFEGQQAKARAGRTAVAEIRFPTPRGVRTLEFIFSPVYDEEGTLEAVAGIARDIDRHKQAESAALQLLTLEQAESSRKEAQLRATQQALQALLSMAEALTSQDGVPRPKMLASADRITRRLAEVARRVLGCERILLVALEAGTERLHPLVTVGERPEDERRWYARMGQLRIGDALPPELSRRLRAGEMVVSERDEQQRGAPTSAASRALLAPMRNGSDLLGVLVIDYGAMPHVISADERAMASAAAHLAALVLQRDRLLREREESRGRELALQETADRLDEFLAVAGHDLRSPLTAAMGYTDFAIHTFERLASAVLERTPDLTEQVEAVRRRMSDALQSMGRLSRLVALLFDAAQARSGTLELHLELCDLGAIMRDQVESLRLAHPHRTIQLEGATGRLVPVVADADRIGQVVTNYLTNAFKYSPEDQAVAVRVKVAGARARVAVEDHGPGLPASEQELIWQRFYRAADIRAQRGSARGLGLGLHICKLLVEAHGGRVGVESAIGQGSTFWFSLPLASAPT